MLSLSDVKGNEKEGEPSKLRGKRSWLVAGRTKLAVDVAGLLRIVLTRPSYRSRSGGGVEG
jgi:hypothetical protein